MNVDEMKDAAFRYCDKAILAVVVLFVVWKVFSFMSPADRAFGPGIAGAGKSPIEPPKDLPKSDADAIRPFLKDSVAEPAILAHDPFWPQTVVMLPQVVLRKPEEPTEDPKALERMKATRELPAKLVGPLVPWNPPDDLLRVIAPDRGRILASMPEMRTPCVVKFTIDPETRKKITFEAVKIGDWIGYQGNLENENKVRIALVVYPGTTDPGRELLGPRDVVLNEEQLGHVVVRWVEKTEPREVATGGAAAKSKKNVVHIRSDYFNVYRQAEGEAQRRPIARIEGRGSARTRRTPARGVMEPGMEGMMPPDAMPPGGEPPMEPMGPPPVDPRRRRAVYDMPPPGARGGMTPEAMMEGGMPPPRERRTTPPARAGRRDGRADFQAGRGERQGEFVYTDSSVESEVKYTYWVEGVALDETGQEFASEYASSGKNTPGAGYTLVTAQKFTFVFVGSRVQNGIAMARIRVFIGRPGVDALESREFNVPVGGWIGDAPQVAGAEAEKKPATEAVGGAPVPRMPAGVAASPDAGGEPPAAEEAKEDEAGQSYVTRHVLVDIVPQARQLVGDDIVISRDGKLVHIKSYKYVPKPKIIIRDRKNRLHELWYQRIKAATTTTTGRDERGKRKVRPRDTPPDYMDEMTPEMMMEGQPRKRPPRKTKVPRR